MLEINVGANLVFALRPTIVCDPMSEENVSISFSDIGLIPVFVRRANTRFAPTLVLLIGLILVFVRDEHKVRPSRRIPKKWTTIYPKIYDRLLIIDKYLKINCSVFGSFDQRINITNSIKQKNKTFQMGAFPKINIKKNSKNKFTSRTGQTSPTGQTCPTCLTVRLVNLFLEHP